MPLRPPSPANSLAVAVVEPPAPSPTTNGNPTNGLAPILLAPNILSVALWNRLLDGHLYSFSVRLN